ncbi:Neuritin Precursor [Takifugu flavidus]|uniref:Neuritin n=2 Tax=Takifugu flavidus TaxID=433684 RepID=A0A5C6NXX4_9TELE|nr:Neuritin Precursor [Takifugu flavidus]
MGVSWSCRCLALCLALHIVSVLTAVGGATRCDSVFKGFSDCLLQLGEDMRSYPEHLDQRQNLQHICR